MALLMLRARRLRHRSLAAAPHRVITSCLVCPCRLVPLQQSSRVQYFTGVWTTSGVPPSFLRLYLIANAGGAYSIASYASATTAFVCSATLPNPNPNSNPNHNPNSNPNPMKCFRGAFEPDNIVAHLSACTN
eukprot:6178938-Pleurochrysis_carterae.AAC.3